MNPLSSSTVGFEAIAAELMQAFQESAPWSSSLVSNMSTVLADMIAGTHDNNQRYIEFAAREAFLRTAKRNSSIFALVRMLGVQVVRRKSAKVSVQLENDAGTPSIIPSYTRIDVAGKPFYSSKPLVIPARGSLEADLTKGYVRTKQFVTGDTDLALKEFELGVPGFVVANHDLKVFTQHPDTGVLTEWEEHQGSMFELNSESQKYIASTLGDGDVGLMFGDGNLGRLLPSNHILIVQYIESDGANGNTEDAVGSKVAVPSVAVVTGYSTSTIAGGAAVKDKLYYKKLAPHIFRSRKRMSSKPDYISNIRLYPGVADVTVVPQREAGPEDLRLMNVVKICILPETGSSWGGQNPVAADNSPTWREFLVWARDKVRPNTDLVPWNPTPIYIDINVDINVHEGYDVRVVRAEIETAIKNLFAHRQGILGRKFALSDLNDAIKLTTEGERRASIDYYTIRTPIEDIPTHDSLSYIALRSLNLYVRQTDRKDLL